MESQDFMQDTFEYVSDYHNKGTRDALQREIDRLKIKDSRDLHASVWTEVRQSGSLIIGETFFKTYGRFRDMGTGSGGRGGKRKPAPWYSKPYYGRLNALMGVVNVRVAEAATRTVMAKLNNI